MSTPGGDRGALAEARLPASTLDVHRLGRPSQTEATIAYRRGRRDYVARRALAIADVAAISMATAVGLAISPVNRDLHDALLLLPIVPLWIFLFKAYGLYEHDGKRISHPPLDELPAIFHAVLLGVLGAWLYSRQFLDHRLVLTESLAIGIGGVVLVVCDRYLARGLVATAFGPARLAFIGADPVVDRLVRKIRVHPEYRLEPVGLITAGQPEHRGSGTVPVLGRLDVDDLSTLLVRHNIERVIVSKELADPSIPSLLQACGPLNVTVALVPEDIAAMGPAAEIDDIEGVAILSLNPLVLGRTSRVLKRGLDLVGATVGLLLALPMILAIAIAIKIDSRGPIFFRQERIGKDGRRFRLAKFRTMHAEAEEVRANLGEFSEDPYWLKIHDDPRVTRVGRLLRLASLDEVPQFWNVLRGDMSLVGPRPLIPIEDEYIAGWSRARLDLAPGMTGLWQVLGRTTLSFEDMVRLDYLYVTNWSLWGDIKLLLRTIPAVVLSRGAN